jgi:hypothetical protein
MLYRVDVRDQNILNYAPETAAVFLYGFTIFCRSVKKQLLHLTADRT